MAAQTGSYHFTLKYKVIDGGPLFNGMSVDMKRLLDRIDLRPRTGDTKSLRTRCRSLASSP